jgi:DNA-binding transcriptional LysR family regulator
VKYRGRIDLTGREVPWSQELSQAPTQAVAFRESFTICARWNSYRWSARGETPYGEKLYLGEWTVADDIASGRLVEVLSEWTPSYPEYCLYYPGRRHMAAGLRAFIDLAKEIVFRNPAKAS